MGGCFYSIRQKIYEELGIYPFRESDEAEGIANFILKHKDVEEILSAIEIIFCALESNNYEKTEELNRYFLQNNVGYRYESGIIIRVDSELGHAEIIQPALRLLSSNKNFKGAEDEFLRAWEHYRHKRYEEAIIAACNAFESVMKVICEAKDWSKEGSAGALTDTLVSNNLFGENCPLKKDVLKALLNNGLVKVRNNMGGHGQGAEVRDVEAYWVRYALQTAAANILLIADAAGPG